MDNVQEVVENMLVDKLFIPAPSLESNLHDDLGMDSLDLVELTVALEEKFKVSVPNEKLMTIKTVGDVVKTIQELVVV